jgi:hypothetical protein
VADFDRSDDLYYTSQFFSNTRIGHVNSTAEFGTPALVWHVSIWPRRHVDPHEFTARDDYAPPRLKLSSGLKLKSDGDVRGELGRRFHDMMDRMQQLGCIFGGDADEPFDWQRGRAGGPSRPDPDSSPFERFDGLRTESRAFTLWWPDPSDGMLRDRPRRLPCPADLRVRVQADVGEHFSTITFIIDSGKPWDGEPVDSTDDARARGQLGQRREEIFRHIDNIRTICEDRLGPQGAPVADLPPLPERICGLPPEPAPPIAGLTEAECVRDPQLRDLYGHWQQEKRAWHAREQAAAAKLAAAADYLYATVWDQFCRAFGFDISDMAGEASEVFASFRGLVMSTSGVAPEAKSATGAGDAAMRMLPRFNGGHDDRDKVHISPDGELDRIADLLVEDILAASDEDILSEAADDHDDVARLAAEMENIVPARAYELCRQNVSQSGENVIPFPAHSSPVQPVSEAIAEPAAVVKAFQPFMRRFRPEADWRDWIACGISGQRAIYISPLGSRSEDRARYEDDFDHAAPAENRMPERLTRKGVDSKLLPLAKHASGLHSRSAPESEAGRPAPLRYLVLTRPGPNRRQVGRMIERINMTGVRRLFALKDWSVLQQANTWVRIYGQKLDEVYSEWIDATKAVREKYWRECNARWEGDIAGIVETLTDSEARERARRAVKLRGDYNQERAITALLNLGYEYRDKRTRFLSLPTRDRRKWDTIRDILNELYGEKEDRDIKLAERNHAAEQALVQITRALDQLGQSAGGLTYRINRSRYFADLYRRQAEALDDSNIETWWSYSQFAKRGMEPTLLFIDSVGEGHMRLQEQLQSIKQDILHSSIAYQTESTRDNTYKLERIQAAIGRIATATEYPVRRLEQRQFLYYSVAVVAAVAALVFGQEHLKMLSQGLLGMFWR